MYFIFTNIYIDLFYDRNLSKLGTNNLTNILSWDQDFKTIAKHYMNYYGKESSIVEASDEEFSNENVSFATSILVKKIYDYNSIKKLSMLI